ncbi:hypothetical protein U0070_022279 [Myodes glareolus]|uniref:Small ribosomal subunit protein eS6 n=1 Tax=Myodes glareolus TaxID=447135 RepID=A0AAW0H322_MYOGA
MKLKISLSATSCQTFIEVVDECRFCTFFVKPIASEVAADSLSRELESEGAREQRSEGAREQESKSESEREREKEREREIPELIDITVP